MELKMSPNKTKIYLESLGCAKNLVDSEVMLGCLNKAGFGFTSSRKSADIIIVNTCAFIEEATREAIETILLLSEQKTRGCCKHLIVCGCLPQRYKHNLTNLLPEVDLFLGTGEFQNISHHINNLSLDNTTPMILVNNESFLMEADTPRILATPRGSAYIKIAEGCSHGCTYCTIPGIKGPYRGRTIESILSETENLARSSNVREINLVAQDTTRFDNLEELLIKLTEIQELRWVRLLYCHPSNLNINIIRLLSEKEKLCSYIDLPLQHVSDRILKKMGRRISRKKTLSLLKTLKTIAPKVALRTTFIVGFPGETDNDFADLLQFVKEAEFDHLGAFQYKDEEGTTSSRLKNKIPDKIKKERFHELMRLQSGISRKKNRAFLGNKITALVEGISLNRKYLLQARTEFQAPEVDGVVYINDKAPIGSFVNLRITKALTYDLVGEVF
ncbi:MAG: 30S ribosomal protein S12 methylthiotransferase RimO [Alphaproteobacteria bacterium]